MPTNFSRFNPYTGTSDRYTGDVNPFRRISGGGYANAPSPGNYTWDAATGTYGPSAAPDPAPTPDPVPPADPVVDPLNPAPVQGSGPPPNPLADVTLVQPPQEQGGSYLMPDRPDLPAPPDPYDVAQQQIGIGQQVQGINAIDQQGVFGLTSYTRDPVTGAIVGARTGLNPTFSGVQNTLLGGFGTRPGDVSDAVYGQYTARLDPQWQTAQRQLETQLTNQGIPQNSEAWNQAMQQFEQNRSAAYLQANQAAQQAGGQEQSRLLGGILDLGGAATSGYQATPAVATPSTAALQYANFQNAADVYNQQLASYNNAMSGLYGLGSDALSTLWDLI